MVSTDEVVPALKSAFTAFGSPLEPGEGAAAVLLTAERSGVAVVGEALGAAGSGAALHAALRRSASSTRRAA